MSYKLIISILMILASLHFGESAIATVLGAWAGILAEQWVTR